MGLIIVITGFGKGKPIKKGCSPLTAHCLLEVLAPSLKMLIVTP